MSKRVNCVVIVISFASAAYGQKIYWSLSSADKIQRANLDGSGVEDVGTSRFFDTLSIDVKEQKLFWPDAASPTGPFHVYSADLDGGNQQYRFTFADPPHAIVVHSRQRKLYWTFGHDFFAGVRRANLDGSLVETIYDTGTSNTIPERITLDEDHGKVYWVVGGLIERANLDGSQPEVLITTTEPYHPWGIAVDPLRNQLYWTEQTESAQQTNRLWRANLDGSAAEMVLSLDTMWESDVGVDPSTGKVYWTEGEWNRIRRADPDGSNVEDVATGGKVNSPVFHYPPPIPTLSSWGVALLGVGLLILGALITRRNGITAIHQSCPNE